MIAQIEDQNRDDAIAAPHFLYGLTLTHKHVPEMKIHGLLDRAPIFSPSVGKFPQGMIVQVPLISTIWRKARRWKASMLRWSAHYAGQDIVTVVPLEESRKAPPRRCCRACWQGHDEAVRASARQARRRSTSWRCSTISARAPRGPPSRTWT